MLSAALSWKDHAYDTSMQKQLLLYVGGEGGTGKSQIIKSIVAGMDLINRKEEIILLAPTGAAADNINGNTIHTSLGISIGKKRPPKASPRVKRLWRNKTIMVIDEISMVDLRMLNTINNHCKSAKSLDRNSSDLFGGLPIVLFMGDFFQFPPVKGRALWKSPKPDNDDDANGQMIWHRFTDVIILEEQMRQAKDPSFRSLLHRARHGELTEEDCALLNSKVITSLFAPELQKAVAISKRNKRRRQINRLKMEHFARSRSQRLYMFPIQVDRIASASSSTLHIRDLLQQEDSGTKVPFQGLLLYTPGMPLMILANICTPLGLVNGARGTASTIVVDPSGMFFIL